MTPLLDYSTTLLVVFPVWLIEVNRLNAYIHECIFSILMAYAIVEPPEIIIDLKTLKSKIHE
jgi:hypothetical protein